MLERELGSGEGGRKEEERGWSGRVGMEREIGAGDGGRREGERAGAGGWG